MFDGYFCGVTGLPCCGCSFFCEHRKKGGMSMFNENSFPMQHCPERGVAYCEGDNSYMKEERKYYLLTNGKYNFIKCYTKSELDYMLKATNWKIIKVI